MKRLFQVLAVAALALASGAPALAAADKPLVIESGKVKQLPASTTLQVNASGTGAASLNLPHGTAPTSPTNGDLWSTTSGFFGRVNGATVGPFTTGTAITAKDEGSTLTSGITSLDFVGGGVVATNTGGAVTVSISGGGVATTNALTITNTGGASPGATFDGSVARTIDYSTVGAAKTGAVTSSGLTQATGKLLGRSTASTGAVEEITVGTGLTLSSGTLSASGSGSSLATPDLMAGQISAILPEYNDATPWTIGVVPVFSNVNAAAYATTNMSTRRLRVLLTHSSAGTSGHVRTNNTGTVVGGTSQYRMRTRWSIVTGPSTLVLAAGSLGNYLPAFPTVTEPSSATNTLIAGFDTTDSNVQIMHNDGSGTATKIDLGSSFPARTTGAYYEAEFDADGSGTINYAVTRFDTGATATGSFSTDVPVENGYLAGFITGVTTAQSWTVAFHGWTFEQNHILRY